VQHLATMRVLVWHLHGADVDAGAVCSGVYRCSPACSGVYRCSPAGGCSFSARVLAAVSTSAALQVVVRFQRAFGQRHLQVQPCRWLFDFRKPSGQLDVRPRIIFDWPVHAPAAASLRWLMGVRADVRPTGC
jgi:hypothetical protein